MQKPSPTITPRPTLEIVPDVRAAAAQLADLDTLRNGVAWLADDTYLAKLERVLNKAHARLLRRWQAQVAREMNEYEAARLAKLLEVPSDGRRF